MVILLNMRNIIENQFENFITLFSDILLEPTNVVLNSFPTWPIMVAPPAVAGDWVGLGLYTIVPAFGLLLS